jgi:hypothetical protein
MDPKSLLINSELQAQLNKDGFISIPFLNEDELDTLRKANQTNHPNGVIPGKIDGIHMTSWCSDFEYKKRVSSSLSELNQAACERTFKNYRTLNNVFIIKEPGGGTTFKVHQDWNVVDEKTNFGINIWVPLHDVDENNGALWVVKGSHLIDRHIRGSAYLFPDYSPFFNELENVAESVSLKAGHAIIFYMNVIHGSPANNSNSDRIVSCFSVIPEKAPLTVYFQKKAGDSLELHSPKDDFMLHYKHLRTETLERPPTDNPEKIMPPYVNKSVNRSELEEFLGKEKKTSWWKKLLIKN